MNWIESAGRSDGRLACELQAPVAWRGPATGSNAPRNAPVAGTQTFHGSMS